MQRRILAALLAVTLLTVQAAAAFTDIEDGFTQQAASALASLGVVSGNGIGQYEPDRLLSRAEFTRLAVASLGITNVDNYNSYTIFPDVPAGHWASGWVNAAVRHPDFAKNPIIRGLGDGRFGPGNPISLGEACTVALRMLGYEQKDIGPNWPTDYVSKAKALGLLSNITVTHPNHSITRGDAAILFRNTLTMDDKEGKPLLTRFTGVEPKQNVILIATSDTDSTLNASQATFYEDLEKIEEFPTDEEGQTMEQKVKTRRVVGMIDPSLVGSHGTIIFDKDDPESVRGFLPDQRLTKEVVLERVEPEGLLADDGSGFVYISRHTPLVIHGSIYPYGEGWAELNEGATVTLHYDANGVIQVIAASMEHYNYPVVIMGINGNEQSIPRGYKIELDGKRLSSAAKLQMYDVVTLNSATKTALVSRNKVTGRYDEASPSFRYPEWIKVLNAKFDIPDSFATSFKQMEPGEQITLLFDTYGRICGVTSDPRAAADTKMEGMVTASNGAEVTVRLFSGVSIRGEVPYHKLKDEFGNILLDEETGEPIEGQTLDDLVVGYEVRVTPYYPSEQDYDKHPEYEGKVLFDVVRSQSGGNQTKDIGNWDVRNRVLGYRTVSKDVQIFEQVGIHVPVTQISEYDIGMDIVPSDQIISFKENSAGVVISITLRDVSGESWVYGRVIDTKLKVPGVDIVDPNTGEVHTTADSYDYRVKLMTLIDGKSEEKEFLLNHSLGIKMRKNQFVGLPKSALENDARMTLAVKEVHSLGNVTLEAFDGYDAVRTRSGYYPIAENVPVYARNLHKFITLQHAKASFTTFELYTDSTLDEGGKIRIIVV